jgi:hypothetical protein
MRPSTWLICGVLCSLLTIRSTAQRLAQDAPAPKAAVAIEPVAAILNAFKSRPVVALSEGEHGNEEGLTFRLSLIRDPAFPRSSTTSSSSVGTPGTKGSWISSSGAAMSLMPNSDRLGGRGSTQASLAIGQSMRILFAESAL